jgi:transposase
MEATRGANQDDAEYWRGEAQRLAGENVVLRAERSELEGQVAALSEKLVTLTKLLYGDSSEKQKKKGKKEEEGAGAPSGKKTGGTGEGDGGPRRRRGQQPGSRGHGRRDNSHLDTEEIVHELDESQRCCGECGTTYAEFGYETSEQIDWQVRVVRIVHRRRSYRRVCGCGVPGIVSAPVPAKPIAKGMFTANFLARLLVEKYVWGRPLSRIAAALASEGFDVAQGTLVGALKATSALLAPLDTAVRARNGAAGHVHVDETSWKVFEDVEGKANHRWWLWVFAAADTTVFTIEPSRSTKVLRDHLGIDADAKSLEDDRRLLISSDFFTVYQSLDRITGVDALWCWAHIRRYFIRAGDAHPEQLADWRDAWVERIAALYRAHQARSSCAAGSMQQRRADQDLAVALTAIDTARGDQAADPTLHPAAVKVLTTLDHEWDGLARHKDFPDLALDNNTAERGLRNPVVGRKNYYGSGAVWAAALAGRVWTITATAQLAGCDPLAYLHAYLDACAANSSRAPTGEDLARFLPWRATPAELAAWRAPGRGGRSP